MPKAYEVVDIPVATGKALADPANGGPWDRFQAANTEFLRDAKAYEKALEDDSFLAHASLPYTQNFTAAFLGLGNEQVYLGRDGWLFYQPEVAYLEWDRAFSGPNFSGPANAADARIKKCSPIRSRRSSPFAINSPSAASISSSCPPRSNR